jgi:hypothetical protein
MSAHKFANFTEDRAQIQYLLELMHFVQGGRCMICRERLDIPNPKTGKKLGNGKIRLEDLPDHPTIDHVIPKWGTEGINHLANYSLVHNKCNHSKSNQRPPNEMIHEAIENFGTLISILQVRQNIYEAEYLELNVAGRTVMTNPFDIYNKRIQKRRILVTAKEHFDKIVADHHGFVIG